MSRLRHSKRLLLGLLGLLSAVAIGVGIAVRQSTTSVTRSTTAGDAATHPVLGNPSPPPQGYVGGDACRRCHQSIWDLYQTHPMSQSAAIVSEATPIEDFYQHPSFEVSTPLGSVDYRVEQSDEGQFHHESMTDPVLGQLYDQKVKIEFVIGTGREGRSYLLLENDCFFVSPIAWYPQAGRWDLSLGYRPGQHPRFERKASELCLSCHTNRVIVDEERPEQFNLKSIQGAGISCERCHGPGREHIAFRDGSPDQIASGTDPIVNPSKLDPVRRESVCWQCHFSADDRVLRYGRGHADFRPGMAFNEIWIPFVRNDAQTPIPAEPVNHVDQMLASHCYRQSEGRFGCLSCHDAHSIPTAENKDHFYRAKCLACHTDRGCSEPIDERTRVTESDSCVACHMPPQRMARLSHTSQTDHRILRKPATKSAAPRKSELAIYHFGDRRLSKIEQDLAWGRYLAKSADLKNDVRQAQLAQQRLATALKSVPDDEEGQEYLGVCEALLGQTDRARDRWKKLLDRHPKHERVLLRLAMLSLDHQDFATARDAFARYLQINPWSGDAQARMASIHAYYGELEAAITFANQSLEVNPADEWPHRFLALVYQRLGKADEAKRHFLWARRLTPQK